jgi:hypothetical protein
VSKQRSRLAELPREGPPTHKFSLPRSSSGSLSRYGDGYCDAPSFELGTEFDTSGSKPEASCITVVDSIDILDDIDPPALERVYLEAELSRKIVHEGEIPELNTVSPDNFDTPNSCRGRQ